MDDNVLEPLLESSYFTEAQRGKSSRRNCEQDIARFTFQTGSYVNAGMFLTPNSRNKKPDFKRKYILYSILRCTVSSLDKDVYQLDVPLETETVLNCN